MDRELVQIIVVALPVVINAVTRLIGALSELLAKRGASEGSAATTVPDTHKEERLHGRSVETSDRDHYPRDHSSVVRSRRRRTRERDVPRRQGNMKSNSEDEYNDN